MRIALLSCFYPFRGGISQFNSFLVKELGKEHTVKAFNFSRQYPSFLFPGKTQYVENPDKAVSEFSTPVLDTANPFSYCKSAREIADFQPDILITRYWMSYFAPSLGTVNRKVSRMLERRCKKEGKEFTFKTISIVDNAIPHEPHFFDKPIGRYYFNSCNGLIAMSNVVKEDILKLKPAAKVELIKHPLYSNYGERIDTANARKEIFGDKAEILGNSKVLLFFGLIRDYKGLDLLLKAMPLLGKGYKLIVAGEPYGGEEKYVKIVESIEDKEIRDNILLDFSFIPDSKVSTLFSAADLCVLPYRSATQSGITSVAWNFDTPVVATPVGGLAEDITATRTGVLTKDVSSESIARAIQFYFDNNMEEECKKNIALLKGKLSWTNFCSKLLNFATTL